MISIIYKFPVPVLTWRPGRGGEGRLQVLWPVRATGQCTPLLWSVAVFCRASFLAGLAGAIASNPIDVIKVGISPVFRSFPHATLPWAASLLSNRQQLTNLASKYIVLLNSPANWFFMDSCRKYFMGNIWTSRGAAGAHLGFSEHCSSILIWTCSCL